MNYIISSIFCIAIFIYIWMLLIFFTVFSSKLSIWIRHFYSGANYMHHYILYLFIFATLTPPAGSIQWHSNSYGKLICQGFNHSRWPCRTIINITPPPTKLIRTDVILVPKQFQYPQVNVWYMYIRIHVARPTTFFTNLNIQI